MSFFSSKGIGRHLTYQLLKLGATVIGVSRNKATQDEMLRSIKDDNERKRFHLHVVDLTDWNETRRVLKEVDHLDGLVNSAAIVHVKYLHETPEAMYDETMNTNLKAAFNLTQFLKSKMNDHGSIVNMSSFAGTCGSRDHAVFGASKAALEEFTRTLVLEFAEKKVRVNTLTATIVEIGMGRNEAWQKEKMRSTVRDRHPMKRFAEVHEIVHPIIFLLSEYSSFITGANIPVDGGFSVSI